MNQDPVKFVPRGLPAYSESYIIEEIKRVVHQECGGVVPSRKEFKRLARVHPGTIVQKFGSYQEALRKAGFIYTEKYTPDQVTANLREVLKRSDGYRFSQDFFAKNGGAYSLKTVKAILRASWDGVQDLIGAKERPRIVQRTALSQRRQILSRLTEVDVFGEIERIWKVRGRCPTNTEFRRESDLRAAYTRLFGSWTKAVEAYCRNRAVPHQGKGGTRATESMLLDDLRRVSAQVPRRSLTYGTYKTMGGTYSRKPFETAFGSWTKAVNAAGGVSGRQQKFSEDELYDELQRLWERFGRQPTLRELQQEGKISTECFHRRFGSWRKAVHSFCEDRNRESPGDIAVDRPPDDLTPRVIVPDNEAPLAPSVVDRNEVGEVLVTRRTGRTIHKKLRFRVLQRDQFTCRACGRSPSIHGIVLEVDHIKAWTNGGETVLENLHALCMDCNRGKSDL